MQILFLSLSLKLFLQHQTLILFGLTSFLIHLHLNVFIYLYVELKSFSLKFFAVGKNLKHFMLFFES